MAASEKKPLATRTQVMRPPLIRLLREGDRGTANAKWLQRCQNCDRNFHVSPGIQFDAPLGVVGV
jgi:hypothetical protein